MAQIIVLACMIYYAKKDSLFFDEVFLKKKNIFRTFKKVIKIGILTGMQSMYFTFIFALYFSNLY